MERRYKALRHVLNGASDSETGRRLGISQTQVARDLESLSQNFPGLLTAIAIVKQVHKEQRRPSGRGQGISQELALATG